MSSRRRPDGPVPASGRHDARTRTATSCHRCSAPVMAVASSCPWCGVAEPGGASFSSAVLGAWLLAGGVGLSVTTVLVDALSRAIG